MPTCTIAHTENARDFVYRLRYACYHRSGAIPACETERFQDRYDELPNHFSFLLETPEPNEAATVRVSVVKPEQGWTGDHPAFQSIAQSTFVEASRLCFGKQARRDAFYRVVEHLAALAELHGAQWVVACPREEHSGIYLGVAFQTTLLALPLEKLRERAASFKSMKSAWAEALVSAAAAGR